MKITTGRFGFFVLGGASAAQSWADRDDTELKRLNDRREQPLQT